MKTPFGILAAALLAVAGCGQTWNIISGGYRFDFQGEQAQRTESGAVLPDTSMVVVENQFGKVRIEPVGDDEPRWEWNLTVWGTTAEDAQAYLEQVQLAYQAEEGRAAWRLELPEPPVDELRGVQSDLTLHVPEHVEVELKNAHGDSELKQLSGSIRLNARHGNATLEDLAGHVVVDHEHGNVTAARLRTAEIANRHGAIEAREVSAGLKIDSAHGTTTVEQIGGALNFTGSHAGISANQVDGDVDLETAHADVLVDRVAGSARLRNAHGSIEARGVNGPLDVENEHGSILLDSPSPEVECRGRHSRMEIVVTNADVRGVLAEGVHSSLEVTLPPTVEHPILATAAHGRVRSDFPTTEDADGDAASYEFRNTHGNIRIHKGAAE